MVVLGVLLITHRTKGGDCYTKVATCPCKEEFWKERSQNVTCRHPQKYACVLHRNHILVEICTTNFKIYKGITGCPYVKVCNENGEAEFGLQSKYEKCPDNIKGCPNKTHQDYSIHQMYLYPACFITNRTDLESRRYDEYCTKPKDINISNRSLTGYNYLWLKIIAPISVFLILVIAVICWYRKRRRNRGNPKDNHERVPLQAKREKDFPNLREQLLEINEAEVKSYQRTYPFLSRFKLPEDSNYFASVILKDDIDYIMNGVRSDGDDLDRIPPKDIETPNDLFEKSKNLLRFIFLRGEAGSGKSTYCLRLLDYWCKSQTDVEGNFGPEEETWINYFKIFDFAFLIRLRDVDKNKSSVIDLICSDVNFGVCNTLHNPIRKVISSDKHKCLIILDGLDEWKPTECDFSCFKIPGLPNFDSMSENVVLISSRQWKLDKLSKFMRETDRMVDIKGLDIEGIRTIFDNIFLHQFEENPDDVKNQFESFKKAYSNSFASNPFLLTAAIHLWHDKVKTKTDESKTHFFLSLLQYLLKRGENPEVVQRSLTEETFSEEMKEILKDYGFLRRYINVFVKLGEIAYNDLVAADTHLVFEEDLLIDLIDDSNLQFLKSVGLMSDTKSPEIKRFSGENIRISFVHKNIQELLAALFVLAARPRTRTLFINELSSVQKIFEFYYLIIFISGFSPRMSNEISEQTVKTADMENDIRKYRATFDYEKYHIIRRLYNLVLDCHKEAKKSERATTEAPTLTASDVFLRIEDKDENVFVENINLTKQLLKESMGVVKSLFLRAISNHDDDEGIPDEVLNEFLCKNPQLQSINIKGVNGDRCFKSADVFNIENIKALILDDVTLTPESLMGIQVKIIKADHLETLGLWNIGYSNSTQRPSATMRQLLQTLPKIRNLTSLYISFTTNKEDRELFIQILPEMKHLQNIQYGGDKTNESMDEIDDNVVKTILRSHSNVLERLWLSYLRLDTDSLDGLEHMNCVKRIEMRKVKMKAQAWETFSVNIEKIQHSFSVALVGTDITKRTRDRLHDIPCLEITRDSSNINWGDLEAFCFKRQMVSNAPNV